MSISLLFALTACVDGGDSDKAGVQTLVLGDENNYAYEGELSFPTYTTAEHVELTIGFSGLDKDMLCHDLDPATGVVSVGLSLFPRLGCDEIATGFTNNSLLSSDLAGYVSVLTAGATEVKLDTLTYAGTEVEIVELYEEVEGGCWVFNLSSGEDYQSDTLFAVNLDPQASSDVDAIELEPSCDVVDFSWDLTTLTPVTVDSSATGWIVDWDALLYTGHGDFFQASEVSTVMVARYDTLTPADLEAQFLDLELIADGMWTEFTTGGSDASLDGLVDASGEPFPGFEPGPTWVLALRCDSCKNPAPVFLTTLIVE